MLDRGVLDAYRLWSRCPPVSTKHNQYGSHPIILGTNQIQRKPNIFKKVTFQKYVFVVSQFLKMLKQWILITNICIE